MKKLNIVFSVVLIAVAAFFFFCADTFKMLPLSLIHISEPTRH